VSLNHISPWIGGGDSGEEANNVAANANATATNQQAVPGENCFCHMLTKFCIVMFPNDCGMMHDKYPCSVSEMQNGYVTLLMEHNR
jgi:hypothetical protein